MIERSRSVIIALSLLCLCGAGDLSSERGDLESTYHPTEAFADFLTGRFAAQHGDMGTAASNLEAALRDDPSIPELRTQAFIAAALAGKSDAALLAAGLPDNPLAQLVLADREAQVGRWDRAEIGFSALSQQQGLTQVLRPLLIAWAQQGQGRTDAALATLTPLVQGSRFRGVYALHAALIADLGGRTADAARLYGTAATEYGVLNLRMGQILASWRARQGELAAAAQTIRDLTATNGDLAIARQGMEANMAAPAVRNAADGIAETYLAMAAALRQQGNEAAQLLLRLALDLRPDFPAARMVLADAEESEKRPESALQTLGEIPASDPLAPVVALRRAALLDQTGKSDEAKSLLDQLAREYPDRPEPLAQEGDMLRRKERFSEAADAYSGAIARLGVPTRVNWPLFYERGVALERAGRWKEAEADLQTALQLSPDQPNVLNYLAYSWTERGENLDRARAMLDKALELRPNDGAIVDSLGWAMLRQGDVQGAVQQLQRAVELQPEDPVINGHYGDALQAAGRLREAEFQWRQALNFKPEADDAKRLTEKLAGLPSPGAAPNATAPR